MDTRPFEASGSQQAPNQVLLEYAKKIKSCGELEKVQSILRDMATQKVQPDADIANRVLAIYLKNQDCDGAEKQFQHFLKRGVRLDSCSMDTMISVFATAKNLQKAKDYFEMVEELGLSYDENISSSMIRALFVTRKKSRFRKPEEVFREALALQAKLESLNVRLKITDFCLFFLLCEDAKDTNQAASVLDDLIQNPPAKGGANAFMRKTVTDAIGGEAAFVEFALSSLARLEGLTRLGFKVPEALYPSSPRPAPFAAPPPLPPPTAAFYSASPLVPSSSSSSSSAYPSLPSSFRPENTLSANKDLGLPANFKKGDW